MEIVYLSIILILLFIVIELYRWNVVHKSCRNMLTKQNDDFVKIHEKLCYDFVIQFKKYNNESIHTQKMVDSYTKMYTNFYDDASKIRRGMINLSKDTLSLQTKLLRDNLSKEEKEKLQIEIDSKIEAFSILAESHKEYTKAI